MPLDLASLKDKKASLRFNFDGEVVTAEFYPHRLTPIYRASLQKLAASEETEEMDVDANAKMLSELLVSWDVMAGDQPYPPTYDNLIAAPQSLVTRVALEIFEAVGKLATPKGSKT